MVSETIRRTLRLKSELDKKVREEAEKIGISVNAYVVMLLSKELQKK